MTNPQPSFDHGLALAHKLVSVLRDSSFLPQYLVALSQAESKVLSSVAERLYFGPYLCYTTGHKNGRYQK